MIDSKNMPTSNQAKLSTNTLINTRLSSSQPSEFRCGKVAMVGLPNAGKSSCINYFMACKVAIVTQKAQTTRHVMHAVLTDDQHQIVFIDTPGILRGKLNSSDASLIKHTRSGVSDADTIVFVVDANVALSQENNRLWGQLSKWIHGKDKAQDHTNHVAHNRANACC